MMGYYPYGHWKGCPCELCTKILGEHNRHEQCNCDGCKNRRVQEYSRQAGRDLRMATVNLCDRCGHMGLSTSFGTVAWRFTDYDGQDTKNICPGCVAELWEFLSQKGGERPPEPYREPFRIVNPQPQESESYIDSLAARLLAKLEIGSSYGKEMEKGKRDIRESDE